MNSKESRIPAAPVVLRWISKRGCRLFVLPTLVCWLGASPANAMTIVKVVTDAFNRTNNSNLGSTDDNQHVSWTKVANNGGGGASSPGITNNTLTFHSATDASAGTSASDTGMGSMQAYLTNYKVKNVRMDVKITPTGTIGPDDKWMGVRWRQAVQGGGGGDGFSFFIRPSGAWVLQADGANVASGSTTAWTSGVGATISVTVTNNSHSVKYNGATLTTVSSGVKPDAGYMALVTYHDDTVAGTEVFGRNYDDFNLTNDDIYRVEDYWGGPGTYWGIPIRSAVADAIAAGPGKTVLFETGVDYSIAAPDPDYGNFFIGISNAVSLTVHANSGGKVIGMIATNGMFKIKKSTNVVVRGITIDYNPLPFSQGLIVAKNTTTGTFDVQIDPGFPKLDNGYFPNPISGSFFSPTLSMIKGNTDAILPGWSKVNANTFRFTTSLDNVTGLVVNQDRFVCTNRKASDGQAITMSDCTNCVLDGVIVNSCPELTFVAMNCTGMTFTNCQIRYGNATRLIASNGDGIHCGGGEVGPLIVDCWFEGLMDDSVNLHGRTRTLMSEITDDLVVTINHDEWRMMAGDRLQIIDPATGQVRRGVVQSAVDIGNNWKVTFTAPVNGIAVNHLVYNLNDSLEGYQIINNVFRQSRNYGGRIRSGNGLIADNCVTNMGLAFLSVQNDITTWIEGPVPYNITIQDNIVDTVGRSLFGKSEGAIQITAQKTDAIATAGYGVTNILLTSNTIKNWPVMGVYVAAATNVVFSNNTFTCATSYSIYGPGTRGVVLGRTSGCKVLSNTFTDQRNDGTSGWLQYGVHLLSNANNTTVSGNSYTLPNYTANFHQDP
jgi:hypothetical protein